MELDDKLQSQTFLNLAKKHLSPERKLLQKQIEGISEEDGLSQGTDMEDYDLIFDTKDHVLIDKEKGCMELKTQFILMDLLKLFLLNPGVSYSKSDIISRIWGEDYKPKTHDNKLYVTIKRLREMIETNSKKPKYIKRNDRGYYFSNKINVLVKD